MASSLPVIGIDLGTTYCCVGYLAPDNHVEIIENEHGDRTTPSYIAFTDDAEVIGKSAKDKVFRNPENIIYDSKRLIGRKYNDQYLQHNLNNWTFKVAPDDNDSPLIQITQKGQVTKYHPHDISAKLLTHMKKCAEKRLGKEVKCAVITVPAHFNYHQRTATIQAGKLAGLNVLTIINEPTAAVLGYVHKHQIHNCENILVFDLGGGSLDVSIVTVKDKNITVRATSGHTHLGGRDFDNNFSQFIAYEIKRIYEKDVTKNKRTMQRIKGITENVKIKLSFENAVEFDIPSFLEGDQDVDMSISRNRFEHINMHLFNRCIQIVENCLDDAKITKSEIEQILLVGGSTRIPKIQYMLSNFFGGEKELIRTVNPDEAVAYGAAVRAAAFQNGDKEEVIPTITDVTPLSLGISTVGDRMSTIIARNTVIPTTEIETYFTTIDKVTEQQITIYEGERSLVKYNTQIGECKIKLSPNPPGYPFEVSFHIDSNGILEVAAKTDTGSYTKVNIVYKKHTSQETSDILRDAMENMQVDNIKIEVIEKLRVLQNYSTMLKGICTYKPGEMNDEEKSTVIAIASTIFTWANSYNVQNGDEAEKRAIAEKQQEIEKVCEPIVNKYGFYVLNMSIQEFYKFITK